MLKVLSIVVLSVFLLNGCTGKNVGYTESGSVEYLLNVIKYTDVPKEVEDLIPDVENAIMLYVKDTLFESSYAVLINEDGYVTYENASAFATNISSLYAICSGKTTLFRNEKLLYEFESNIKENAYLSLGNLLAGHIFDSRYVGGQVNDLCLKGSVLVAEFSIAPSNYDDIIKDKDVYKYLDLKVSIIDQQYMIK